MKVVTEIINRVLLKRLSPSEGEVTINNWLKKQSDTHIKSKTTCAHRLCRSLNEIESGKSSWYDFASHLRQYILFLKHRVKLHGDYFNIIKELAIEFNLTINEYTKEVDASKRLPNWIKHQNYLDDLYDLKQRNQLESELGDGILHSMTNYKYYTSSFQKSIVKESMNLPEGHTMLACMQTGGGKSLVSQLPAYFETEGGLVGGNIEGRGITIVVVPTVSLAVDQELASRKYFKNALNDNYKPYAYYGSLKEEKKNLIIKGIENGTIPLVYTSPEAILSGKFNKALLKAAKTGKLSRLVIDEAHIVLDWGSSFRTDFQLLAPFRRRLLQETKGKLKTILLSATLNERTTQLLKDLFSEGDNLIEIRSDALRPEPMYWIDFSKTNAEREKKVLDLLPLLPKPIILYVTKPEKAEIWKKIINEKGFLSIETFTGETTGIRREEIIKCWNSNKIDIMVATTAFGMGVSKPDVRTILHCCIPDSLNRFYQEVGRGGRDGFPSISLLSYVDNEDYEETNNHIKLITPGMIVKRWFSILNQSIEREDIDSVWIDMGAVHEDLVRDSKRNAYWNEITVLFLYRKGLIDIIDIKNNVNERRQILVKLIKHEVLQNKIKLNSFIEPLRSEERDDIVQEFEKMEDLIKNSDNNCWSTFLVDEYPYTSEVCGSCPSCRNYEYQFYFTNNNMKILKEKNNIEIVSTLRNSKVKKYLGHNKDLFIYFQYSEYRMTNIKLYKLSRELIKSGIQNIIIPNVDSDIWDKWIKELSYEENSKQNIFSIKEILDKHNQYDLNGPIAIFFSEHNIFSDKIYEWARQYMINTNNQVVFIGTREMYIIFKHENKLLGDHIEGLHIPVNMFIDNVEEILNFL